MFTLLGIGTGSTQIHGAIRPILQYAHTNGRIARKMGWLCGCFKWYQWTEDVAGHWREVGEHSRMPIDGTVWLTDPIESSFIPSRVFKVIQQQNSEIATAFLRRAREALFAFNKNIAKDDILIELVNQVGLDGEKIVAQSKFPMLKRHYKRISSSSVNWVYADFRQSFY